MAQRYRTPGPATGALEEASVPYSPDEESFSNLEQVAQSHAPSLMAIAGVEGVAAGRDPSSRPAVVVYVRDASVTARLPKQVDGYPVSAVVTGKIEAY
jgi:hypothetical protein